MSTTTRSPGSVSSPGGSLAAPPSPLRILDITDTYSDTVSGGVKTYLHAKIRHLAGRDVEHALAIPGPRTATETQYATRVHRIRGPVVPVSRAYRVMLSPRALRRVLWRERPHVVEIGSPFIIPWLVARAARGMDVRTVGFYHADVIRTFAEPYVPHRTAAPLRVAARTLARRLVSRVYSAFDVTVASSASVARELRELGVPRVRHVSLGVDLETFRPREAWERLSRTELGLPDDGVPVGVYVGRFCAEKRLDVLLDGHARIAPEERPHLLLVGGGPHRERLETVVRNRPRVHLHPYVQDREALARLYAASDFYAAPGPGETFGLSIGEALASGLPVVVVDRGAGPDRVAGSGCGERYVHGDPQSCAEALRRLVSRLSPDLRARARAHAEATLDWAGTFDRLLELYRELATGGVRS